MRLFPLFSFLLLLLVLLASALRCQKLLESAFDLNLAAFALLRHWLGARLEQVDRLSFVFCTETQRKQVGSDVRGHLREMKGTEFSWFHHSSEISIVSMALA